VPKRKKSDLPALTEWRAVDKAIGVIATLEGEAARVTAEAEEEIRKIREDAAARASRDRLAAEEFRDAIEAFSEAHKEEFGKARSLALPHGRIGWRRVPRVKFLVKAATLVAALEGRGLAAAVITKKSPNKEILATYPRHVLDDVGARLVVDEKFYVEPKTETEPG
jgi:phage host-nuclease inhibitor protein Gam